MSLLYHYASNQKGFGILRNKNIRLCDIRKSNDYNELLLFYPEIFHEILQVYREKPYKFKYEGYVDEDAIFALVSVTKDMIADYVREGELSNFVLCFSEDADLLSQWRGYADDGKGISIGFSKEILQQKCNEENSVFRLEKVRYITEERRERMIRARAVSVTRALQGLRKWIVKNITLDDSDKDTDGLLGFNLFGLIKNIMIDSLQYKQVGFKEEKEWRLFLCDQAYKNPEWVLSQENAVEEARVYSGTRDYLRNRIEFNIGDDNITPYIALPFSDLQDGFVKEIWIGPKSRIVQKDIELYLAKNGYHNTSVFYSQTSYQ